MIRLIGAVITLCSLASAGQVPATATGKALGRWDAPIRIDLYSDYQCPGCKAMHEGTLRSLVSDYVNTGKVYLVNREFPLPGHKHAREAACLACAADKLGKYGQVADQLFLTQQKWSVDGNVVGPACSVLTPAEGKRLVEFARGPEVGKMVDDDIRAGISAKVGGTPTMIVTRLIQRFNVGHVSYPVLSKFLDSLLK